MENLKNKTCCWIDNGLFVDFALRYASEFKRTLYWMPWVSSFPKSNQLLVGDGFDEIERIRFLWDHVDEIDLFICPDIYFGDVAEQLVRMGKPVWSGRHGDDLELYRDDSKRLIGELGLPVAPWKLVIGLPALRQYLKEHDNQWIKVSTVRGDFETFKSPSYELIEPRLDELEWRLGAKKNIYEFIVEGGIDDAVEIGYDGWVVDGEYPPESMTAVEIKDLGMMGVAVPYDELTEPVKIVNAKLAPYFRKMQYRGFFASEIRIQKDGIPFLIDPCCRCGTPSNEILQEMFTNWPQIWWEGAHGRIIPPERAHKFGVEAMIHSAWADKNWQAIKFPEEIRQFVKLRNHTKILGRDYVVPLETSLPEIGAVVGVGESIEEAVQQLTDNASKIEGYFIEIKLDSISKALHEFEQAKEFGMQLTTETLPDPEELNEIVEAHAAAD